MSTQLPQLQDFSDHLSPMVVKEMRQGLRTRFFTAALILAIRETNRLRALAISSDSTISRSDAKVS